MKKIILLLAVLYCLLSVVKGQSVPSSDIKILPTSKVELFEWQNQTKVRLLVNLHNDNDDGTIWYGTVILPYQAQVLDWNNCYEPYFYFEPRDYIAGRMVCGGVFIGVNNVDEFSVVVEPQIGQMKFAVFLSGDAPDPNMTNNYQVFTLDFQK